jgi:hypothetical protein
LSDAQSFADMKRLALGLGILLLGALVLSPAVAAIGLEHMPGDIAFKLGDAQVAIPVAYSLCASVGLALLYKVLKR